MRRGDAAAPGKPRGRAERSVDVRLPAGTHDDLRFLAGLQGRPVQGVIRHAVNLYLGRYDLRGLRRRHGEAVQDCTVRGGNHAHGT